MLLLVCMFLFFFFFKQKTAYEMRISDWSSDVCSSDLQIEWLIAGIKAMINAVAIQFPTLFVIDQVGDHHLVQHLIMHGRVFNGSHIFDTPIEIARHPVGRADIDLPLPVGQFPPLSKYRQSTRLNPSNECASHKHYSG